MSHAPGLREPPTSPSPAAGCSLLGFSRASGEFLKSCLRGVGFYSVEVTAGLVDGFCPRRLPQRRHISRRRLFRLPEAHQFSPVHCLFRAQPRGGDGFDGVNSGEPFPPWAAGWKEHGWIKILTSMAEMCRGNGNGAPSSFLDTTSTAAAAAVLGFQKNAQMMQKPPLTPMSLDLR
ncbi:hypothetical protein Cgig2_020940 [Carnegiea gigantea]|uniref:Uncharacterized protein n=1 Tax=Carnegiea gigantea TaxID=171969 RepID=A0A9Q1JPN8_9CARY|nr:hypothetical protein Cgig2_020940 [Carnegiea gigantea]